MYYIFLFTSNILARKKSFIEEYLHVENYRIYFDNLWFHRNLHLIFYLKVLVLIRCKNYLASLRHWMETNRLDNEQSTK